MKTHNENLNRRNFLTAGAAGLALTALGGTRQARAEISTIEQANLELVLAMCRDIANLDMTAMQSYFSDQIEFQLFDGQPIIKGLEAFTNFGNTFMTAYERAEFIVHRSHVLGNLVINERTDNFFAKEGGQNQSFHVTGFFVVKGGEIHEWKDYLVPRSKPDAEPGAEAEAQPAGEE
jgi:limonene-1,2-epoxide hydrolase